MQVQFFTDRADDFRPVRSFYPGNRSVRPLAILTLAGWDRIPGATVATPGSAARPADTLDVYVGSLDHLDRIIDACLALRADMTARPPAAVCSLPAGGSPGPGPAASPPADGLNAEAVAEAVKGDGGPVG